MVDFSKTDLRKLASRLSSLHYFHPEIKPVSKPTIIVSPPEAPHEIRKAEAVLRVLEASKKFDKKEIEKMKKRIEDLKGL